MDRQAALKKASAFVRLARQVVPVGEAYLFGSHATGNATEDSDLDVAVLVPTLNCDYLGTLTRLYRLRGEVDLRIEPHLAVQDSDPQGFSREIVRTGIRL